RTHGTHSCDAVEIFQSSAGADVAENRPGTAHIGVHATRGAWLVYGAVDLGQRRSRVAQYWRRHDRLISLRAATQKGVLLFSEMGYAAVAVHRSPSAAAISPIYFAPDCIHPVGACQAFIPENMLSPGVDSRVGELSVEHEANIQKTADLALLKDS